MNEYETYKTIIQLQANRQILQDAEHCWLLGSSAMGMKTLSTSASFQYEMYQQTKM